MKFRVLSLLVFIFSLSGTPLQAQHPVYRHFTIDDGLPSSEIYHIFQDSRGYIWIATNMGVSRYDGNKFTNFDKQDGLAENTVFEVYEDESGRVWFVSFPCQLSYYYEGSIHAYRYNEVLKSQVGGYAVPFKFSFTVSDNEEISLGLMYEGLISIDKNGKLKKLHPSGEESRSVHLYIKSDKVLISQGNNMDLSNLTIHRNGSIKKFDYSDKPVDYTHGQMMAVTNGRNQVVFMQNNLLASFLEDNKPQIRIIDNRIFSIYADHKNNIWVATEKNGVFCFKDGNITSKPVHHLLKGISISAVFQDSEDGMWFSTFTDGIFYLPYGTFSSYTEEEGLSSNSVNAIVLRKNEVIIGTNDEFVNILSHDKIKQTRISVKENDRIQAMNLDYNGSIWIGMVEYLYNYSLTGKIAKFSNTKNKLFPGMVQNQKSRNIFSIKSITNSIDGGIWLGESNAFSKFKNNKLIYNSLVVDSVGLRTEALLQIGDGTLYIGSMNGLWRFNDSNFINLGKVNTLLGNRVTDIKYSKKCNLLFIGTKGSGILVYNLHDSVYQIVKSHGLSSNSISSLLLLDNYLWVGTNYGLNVFDVSKIGKRDFKITTYFKSNGLISNEINKLAGDEKNVYIATNQGMTIFNYRDYKTVKVKPPVYISGFSIMKRDTLIKSGYKLKDNQNLITFHYIGLSFRDAGNLIYKYRLKGLSEEWNYTSNTEVEYAFLPPRTYIFEVVAINPEGIESAEAAKISFTILPPFYKTWWFILIMLLILAAGVYFLYRNRLKQLRKEHELRNDINWYRQQALSKQMDPHFVFNTLNSIQSFIIKNDRLSSSQYLSKFAKLMRLILNNSQKQSVSIGDEINAINLYLELESLRFQQKFEFHLEIDPKIDTSTCFIPAFLIQPYVENAIWHGIMGLDKPGRITIQLIKKQNEITCIVEDNGIGRKRSQDMKTDLERKKQSYGIELVDSRLKLLNNLYDIDMKVVFIDLYAETGQSAGTRVIINLPLIA